MSSWYVKILLNLVFFSFLAANSSSSSPSPYDILSQYGLPQGLLPNSVKSYSLNGDGSFEIELQNPCYVQFEKLVYYAKKITGKISYGAISNISGIQAKQLFFWVSVTGMKVLSPEYIEFDAGPISEKLSSKQFQTIPSCKKRGSKMKEESLPAITSPRNRLIKRSAENAVW